MYVSMLCVSIYLIFWNACMHVIYAMYVWNVCMEYMYGMKICMEYIYGWSLCIYGIIYCTDGCLCTVCMVCMVWYVYMECTFGIHT